MAKRVEVKTELTAEALHKKYRKAKDAVERTHWHILWLVKEGHTPREVAEQLGYTAGWVRAIVRRWNEAGSQGITDKRRRLPGAKPLLTSSQQAELVEVLHKPPSDGGLWSGPKVAAWMQEQLGRPVDARRGWDYLQRLGYSSRVPRPQHAKADEQEQEAFKKTARGGRGASSGVSSSSHRAVERRRASYRAETDFATCMGSQRNSRQSRRSPALSVDVCVCLCTS